MSASGSGNGPTPTPSTTNTTILGAAGTPGRATVPVGDLLVGDGHDAPIANTFIEQCDGCIPMALDYFVTRKNADDGSKQALTIHDLAAQNHPHSS